MLFISLMCIWYSLVLPMNLKVLSKILGHANTSTTINTYVHAEDDIVSYELGKFESYLDTNDPNRAKKIGVKSGVKTMIRNQYLS